MINQQMIDNTPCPICGGIEGCDHTVLERRRVEAAARAMCLHPALEAAAMTGMILELHRQGLKVTAIARQLGRCSEPISI